MFEVLNVIFEYLCKLFFVLMLMMVLVFVLIVLLLGVVGDFVGYIGVSVILVVSFFYIILLMIIVVFVGCVKNFYIGELKCLWW